MSKTTAAMKMVQASGETCHIHCINQDTCHPNCGKTTAEICKATWITLINSMVVFGKIMCLILNMTTVSYDSIAKTKSPTFQRFCLLILWVCLILLGTTLFIVYRNNTERTCRKNTSSQPCSFQHCLAIFNDLSTKPNKLQYPERCVSYGGKNCAPSVRCYKYDLNILILFRVVHLEVASMNANENLNNTIYRVYLFTVNDCQTGISTSKGNVEIVICIILTLEDVTKYWAHSSFQHLTGIINEEVLRKELKSANDPSLKITFAKSTIYVNVDTCGLDNNRDKQTFEFKKSTVVSAKIHLFNVNQMCLQKVLGVNMYKADKQTLIRVFRMKRITVYIGFGPRDTCLSFLHGHNGKCHSAMENDVKKLKCSPGQNDEKSLPPNSTITNVETPSVKYAELANNVRFGHDGLNAKSSVGNETNTFNVETDDTFKLQNLKDVINHIACLYREKTFLCVDAHSIAKRVRVFQDRHDERGNVSSCLQKRPFYEIPDRKYTQQKNQTTKDVEHKCNGKGILKLILKDTSSVCILAPRICIVAPVTGNEHCGSKPQVDVLRKLYDVVERTLKSVSVPAQESMVFELLRICTFRTFPKNDKPDVGAFAAAGFYYASQNDEVICYCCYKRISNWGKSDDPSAVHVRISPECKFHTSNSEVNVSKAVTESVQSDILAKLQGNKRSSIATNSNNTTLSMSMVPPRVIDGKRSIATGQNYESRVAMNTSQKTHTNQAFPTDSLTSTSRPPNATAGRFQSMIPQTFSADIDSSKTSRFQTGKFVSSVNFAIPDSNTKAIQPVDDAIEPGITIDEYIDEYNSGSNGGNKSISKASTQTTDTGGISSICLNGIVESLITSEASVIVQGMGYSSSLMKQALYRLVNKGKTKIGPQDIMQEIFLIEDE
ncbi:uncharacterized protein LOC127834626 isoform X2 [Dreissena polymorpha]|uniref:uncharacterized protein LOC127834626 isoform X2 n=1 Tax=Dreissena polymorpha TaxID=45954 RepID=UPI00226470BD|nr:uncharacterized protein LOC127834626 isoform X2 [Dreissena polymorpha]